MGIVTSHSPRAARIFRVILGGIGVRFRDLVQSLSRLGPLSHSVELSARVRVATATAAGVASDRKRDERKHRGTTLLPMWTPGAANCPSLRELTVPRLHGKAPDSAKATFPLFVPSSSVCDHLIDLCPAEYVSKPSGTDGTAEPFVQEEGAVHEWIFHLHNAYRPAEATVVVGGYASGASESHARVA
jgi:hypothetical protein